MDQEIISEKFFKAVEYQKNGEITMAIQMYASIANEYGDYRPAFINLGNLYLKNNNLDDALFCYKKSYELLEDFTSIYNIGLIYYKKSEYKNSSIFLEKAKKLNNSFSMIFLLLGLNYYHLKNFSAAENNLEYFLNIEPSNEVALTTLSYYYYDKKMYSKALVNVNKLLELFPEKTAISKLKYKIIVDSKEINNIIKVVNEEPAFTDFNGYIKTIPDNCFSDKFGDMNDKIMKLENSILENNNKEDMISLSLCHLLNGDTEKAMEYLFQAGK